MGREEKEFNRFFITEADGSVSTAWAYRYTKLASFQKWLSYIMTVFIIRLVFHWYPQLYIKVAMSACFVEQADRILIQDSAGVYYVVDVNKKSDDSRSKSCGCVLDKSKMFTIDSLPNLKVRASESWIYYKNLKYEFDAVESRYLLLPNWDERPACDIVDAEPLEAPEVYRRRLIYGENDIPIPRRSVMQLLLKEGLNQFYVFQVLSCILWFSDEYYYYAAAIVVISATSLAWNIYELRRNEKALRDTVTTFGSVEVCREVNGVSKFFSVDSTDIVPGDIIEIPRDGCHMFCDAVLLHGNCIVNESTLTGESVPVTKIPFVAPAAAAAATVEEMKKGSGDSAAAMAAASASAPMFELKGSSKSVLFCGTDVIQSRNFADQRVTAVVVRTGFRTAKGEMVRAILFPKPLRFAFNRDVNRFVCLLGCVALVGFCISVYLQVRNGTEAGRILVKALDIITIAVPPALPIAMAAGVAFAQSRLKRRSIFCINNSAINVCGIINVACFDKTGTITEDGLDLWGVIPNGEGEFERPVHNPSELPQAPLLETMATCHSLTRIEGELSGDPLDLKMFLSTDWEFMEEISEDHCKFEMTVPAVVRPRAPASSSSSSSSTDTVVSLADAETLPYEIGIVRQFPFSSTLQRMSVIARALNGSHFSIYTKGSPEMIESLCRKETLPRDFHKVLLEYTREGYRVIALAWRPLRVAYTKVMRLERSNIERQLEFLGLLVMENRLKCESAPVMKVLKEANIRPVMVTGDNMLTALSVARDCEMIEEMDRIIIVSAKPPPETVGSPEVAVGALLGGGGGVVGETEETWRQLVQFHYAEDLHRPVTEVTATSGRRKAVAMRTEGDEEDFGVEAEGGGVRRVLNKWLQVLCHGRGRERPAEEVDAEAGGTMVVGNGAVATGGHVDVGRRRAAAAKHRITLRMVDRPDFHLAITGKTWAIIREHFPCLIPKLVVKGTVFARFSPEQKAQLIESLQSVGYFVSMCGDGANDCGALKAANAGIALSQAEASVASHFTSGLENISCVPKLIREGRCALATSFGTFKFMMGYSLTQFTSVLFLYYMDTTLSDFQFLYIDLVVIMSLSLTFGYASAYGRLSVEPPTMRLVSSTTLLSMGSQLLLVIGTQLATFLYIQAQPWYFNSGDFQNTAIFTVSSFQYIFLAVIFSKGAPYRKSILHNYLFLGNVLAVVGTNLLLALYHDEGLMEFMELTVLPSKITHVMLLLIALANFLLGYLIEMLVEGVAFRRRMREVRKTLFPRWVARKDYERIREEIDCMAGKWPPIIRSASIQDIRTEFFGEEHSPRQRHISGGRRRLDDSGDYGSDQDEEVMAAAMENLGANEKRTTSSAGAAGKAFDSEVRRSQSLEETDLRDLLEEREHFLMAAAGKESMEASGGYVGGIGGNVGVAGPVLRISPKRTRTKSSGTCDQRKGPADAAKIPVLPLHDPGLS